MKKSLISTLVASAISSPVWAQSAQPLLPSLETVVVVASRTETPLRELGTSVAVMDELQISAQGFTALADVLRTLPSVSVSNSGGMGKTSSISVRGESGYRTQVRIDGVDITDPTGTQAGAQIQHVLTSNVGRVELLRGPQGMMYGADAGGVLNISTRQTDGDLRINALAEAGRYGTENYNVSVGAGGQALDYFMAASRAQTDGFNAHEKDIELADKDGYTNTTLHGRLGWQATESLRVQAVLRNTDAESEFDRCFDVYDCVEDFSQQNARASVSYTTGTLNHELAYSVADIERTNYAEGAVSYDVEGSVSKLELLGNVNLTSAHALVYGLEQRADKVRQAERDQLGLLAEYQGQFIDRIFVTLGVREDDNDDFGSHTSYRASAAYVLPVAVGEIKFKTSYGTGFRAPSLSEIDYNQSQNNPDLAPLEAETSEGFDVGVSYFAASGLHLEAVWFDQSIDNAIDFDMVGYTGYMQVQGESRSRGIELAAGVPISDALVVHANYTWVDASEIDGSPRLRRPEHLANLSLLYSPTDKLQTAVHLRVASSVTDAFGSSAYLDGYQVAGASVRYQVLP
ncbi:MAG TPA: TonB-dependent receptor, partial [Cellvibrionaceae bacterium]